MAGFPDLTYQTSTAFSPRADMPVVLRKSIDQDGWSYVTLDDLGARMVAAEDVIPAVPQKIGVVRLAQKWVAQNAAKARMIVRRKVAGTPADPETDPEIVRIWNASKPRKLMARILSDLYGPGKGNSLVLKVRDKNSKKVLKLRPLNMQKCTWSESRGVWIYDGEGQLRENLIWFSLGSDPDNFESGENQWIGFEDDLRTLREESAYTADILTNAGVVGMVISKDDAMSTFSPAAVRKMQRDGKAMTTRGKRGSVLVSGTGLKVNEVGQGPDRLALDVLPRGAQARVSSNLGVALMTLGMPDENKTYSNLQEANKGSYRTGVVPFHDLIAETLADDLLNDTGYSPEDYEICFDYSDLEEFAEDVDKVRTRVREDVKAGLITPNEGRAETGRDVSDDPTADSLRSSSAPQEAARP